MKKEKTTLNLMSEKALLEKVLKDPKTINVETFRRYQEICLEIEKRIAIKKHDSNRERKIARLQKKFHDYIDNIDLLHDKVIFHENMSGKMEGMSGLSTSCLHNTHCQNRIKNNIGICKHCFAKSILEQYNMVNKETDTLEAFSDTYINMYHNYILLTSRELNKSQFPKVTSSIFRFESLGDLQNETQVKNYFNLCNWNQSTKFTLWTKNPWLIRNVISEGYEKPSNLIIIYSNPYLNNEAYKTYAYDYSLMTPERYFNLYPFIDKVFSVFEWEYAINNNIAINCCDKHCHDCKICYSNNNIQFVNEILKKDQKAFKNHGGIVL